MIPRRINLQEQDASEAAIRRAVELIETLGADVRLTDAVILLDAARESVADYIDKSPLIRRNVVTSLAAVPVETPTPPRNRYTPTGQTMKADPSFSFPTESSKDRRCGSQGIDADGQCNRCGYPVDMDTNDDRPECPPAFLEPPEAAAPAPAGARTPGEPEQTHTCRCGHGRDDHQSRTEQEDGQKVQVEKCEHCPCRAYVRRFGPLDTLVENYRATALPASQGTAPAPPKEQP
jgi:hypothetical protein